MNTPDDHLLWPDRLEAFIEGLSQFTRVVVISETSSTQDALARLDPEPGVLLVTARQTKGRGRLGRSWADDEGAGLALSFAVEPASSALLCARAAISISSAFTPLIADHGIRSGLKWPNDFLVLLDRPRKVAGVLVEQSGECMMVGIGVNVRSRCWPAELNDTACSLEDAGVLISRLDAITRLLSAWQKTASSSEDQLREAFREADLLQGCRARFEELGVIHEGVVTGIDPFTGVSLRTETGVTLMRPDLARLQAWEGLC
jgi:biotin-[acetyl-CoA-carboxylase] ligase BirA-like protein